MTGSTVLIVEDDPRLVKLLRRTLETEGYDVVIANDAETALAALTTSSPGVILMDVGLPGMDGIELTRRLRANEATRHIPVLAMTADQSESVAWETIEAGSDSHLVKPIPNHLLVEVVRAYADQPTSPCGGL